MKSNRDALGIIVNRSPRARLTVSINAAHEQRAFIVGPGIDEQVTGRGEGVVVFDRVIGFGAYCVSAASRPPGSVAWLPSRVYQTGETSAGFDDTGGDSDFNDLVVTLS